VTITATDTGTPPQSANVAFTITVVAGNRPPVLAPVGAKTTSVGQLLAFTATATDPDGNALAFSAGNLPAGAAFTPAGAFSWTPDAGQLGSFSVTLTVTDDGSPPQMASETITITVGGVNRPPVLDPIGAKTGNEGALLTFTASGSDPDGNTLTFSATGLPPGATLTPAGLFTWTPDFTQSGNYTVPFSVSDGALSASEPVTITVGNVNRPPVLLPSPIGNRSVAVGATLAIALTASDPDGDTLLFTSANLPAGATLVPNGAGAATFTWTPSAAQSGAFADVTIGVSDATLSDSEVFTITVGGPAASPVSLREAEWSDARLKAEGRAAPGASVTIVDADSGATLGSVTADASGKWKARLALAAAPCRVQANAGGQSSAIVNVKDAPRSCRPGEHDDDDDDEGDDDHGDDHHDGGGDDHGDHGGRRGG
jgi:PKD repeat protein